jgi:hypothetical protein
LATHTGSFSPVSGGMRQDRVMLLIVIDHEEPEDQQARQNTAHDLAGQMEVPERAGHGARQQHAGGEDGPPAPRAGFLREGAGGQD